jgi:hypothetical protein
MISHDLPRADQRGAEQARMLAADALPVICPAVPLTSGRS